MYRISKNEYLVPDDVSVPEPFILYFIMIQVDHCTFRYGDTIV